jgi:hypothetical protein
MMISIHPRRLIMQEMKAKGLKSRNFFVGIALALAVVFAFIATKRSYTFRLTPALVEAYLRSKFPYEKRELIFTARFTDPSVEIDAATNQVTLTVSATASAVGYEAASSEVQATGNVRYEPDSGEVFLDSPTVILQELEIPGVSDRNQERAVLALQRGLQFYLERKPLYRLKKKGPLKSLRVRDGAIELAVGY